MSVEHTILYKNNTRKTVKLTPMKAIREKCLECSCWSFKEVRLCPVKDCALYPFRYGKRPDSGEKEGT